MLTEGLFTATITRCQLTTLGDKDAVRVGLEIDGDATDTLIFLTEKAMGIARRRLKICGFDVDARDLSDLVTDPSTLAGNRVPVILETYNNRLRAEIPTDGGAPSATKVKSYTAALRAAKKDNEAVVAVQAPSAPRETAPPIDDDDIPF